MVVRYATKALNSLKSTLKYQRLEDLPPSITYPLKRSPQFAAFLQKKLENKGRIEEETETNPEARERRTNYENLFLKPDFGLKVDLPLTSSTETTYSSEKHVGTPMKKTMEQAVADFEKFFEGFKGESFAGFDMETYQRIQSDIPMHSLANLLKSHKITRHKTVSTEELAERIFDSEEMRAYVTKRNEFITQNNIQIPNEEFLYDMPVELEIESIVKQNHEPLLKWMNDQWQIFVNYSKQMQAFNKPYYETYVKQNTKSEKEAALLLDTIYKVEEINFLRSSLSFTTQPCFQIRLKEVKPILDRIASLTRDFESTVLQITRSKYPQLSKMVEKLSQVSKIKTDFLASNPEAHLYWLQASPINKIHQNYQEENNTPKFMGVVLNSLKSYKGQLEPLFSVEEYNEFKKVIINNIDALDNDTYGFLQSTVENFKSDATMDLRPLDISNNEDALVMKKINTRVKKALKEGKTPFKAIFNVDNYVELFSHLSRTRNSAEIKEMLPAYQSKYIADTKLPIHHLTVRKSYGFLHSGIKYPADKVVKLTVRLADIDFSSDIARQNFIKLVKGDMKAKYKKRFSEIKQSVTLRCSLYDTKEENINYLQNLLVELIRAAESFDTLIPDVPSITTTETREQLQQRFLDEDTKAEAALEAWAMHRRAGKVAVGADLTYGEGVKKEETREEEIVEDYGYNTYNVEDLQDINIDEDSNLKK
ncbi:hypothetical protein C9374_000530 [Naegleria lovaniensis]|uniref:Small ribosomal subunit protein mS35 mitochondrial conserved domain-containing protein n=1 Tax=Naegleria lovaniensis TaxID=51637 RepID=A0AA88GTZ1_NAELO|nr:uncharacterized protein C9374_000530 [Naegleria lovaniensis]KAG2388366.1 hypothetical protein C9374_000530 [Naegleria lovaniensis]